MKKLLTLLACLLCGSALAQLPPILRNPFTTNSNPNGLLVLQTNGAYELQTTLPLSIPGGLLLGGTNGAGTNNLWKTNFNKDIIPLQMLYVGTAATLTNSDPILADAVDKTTNNAVYIGYIPADIDPLIPVKVIFTATRTGANGDVVHSFNYAQGTTFPGTATSEVLSTNTYTGSGLRQLTFATQTPWAFTAGTAVVVIVARDGDDAADTLTVPITVRQVFLEVYRR